MRIAFIVDTFPVLSETFILNQITGLIDLGHEIVIFTGSDKKPDKVPSDVTNYKLTEKTFCINDKPFKRYVRYITALKFFFEHPFISIRTLNFFTLGKEAFSLNVLYKVRNFMKRGRFDIVQCHFGSNGNTGAMLKEAGLNFKLVTMFHGYDIRDGLSSTSDIYSRLKKRGDIFLSISKYNNDSLIALGFDQNRIIHHPVGIDLSSIDFTPRKIEPTEDKKITILTVARLVEEKGLEFGIRAFYLLKQHFKDRQLEYLIIGGGPLRKELKELTSNLGIENSVSFLGECSHENINERLKAGDLFLLPSMAEALPVSIMEAQASGLPVLASNVGSVKELVVDGKSGYLLKAGDVNDIFEKMKYLINCPEKWQKIAITGRQLVEEHYDINKLNLQLEGIYKRILNERT